MHDRRNIGLRSSFLSCTGRKERRVGEDEGASWTRVGFPTHPQVSLEVVVCGDPVHNRRPGAGVWRPLRSTFGRLMQAGGRCPLLRLKCHPGVLWEKGRSPLGVEADTVSAFGGGAQGGEGRCVAAVAGSGLGGAGPPSGGLPRSHRGEGRQMRIPSLLPQNILGLQGCVRQTRATPLTEVFAWAFYVFGGAPYLLARFQRRHHFGGVV